MLYWPCIRVVGEMGRGPTALDVGVCPLPRVSALVKGGRGNTPARNVACFTRHCPVVSHTRMS